MTGELLTARKIEVAVHHIGSASVTGLSAKPIIDIMPVVQNISGVDEHNAAFESIGYECKVFGRKSNAMETYHKK